MEEIGCVSCGGDYALEVSKTLRAAAVEQPELTEALVRQNIALQANVIDDASIEGIGDRVDLLA